MRRSFFNTRKGLLYLFFLFVLCCCSLLLVLTTKTTGKTLFHDTQIEASRLMKDFEDFLYTYIIDHNIGIEPEDLNRTGLIGPAYSHLMTTMGDIAAKRTSLDPNFAAVLVKYFVNAGLKQGDTVAIGSSGSFPALAIASICACNALGLNAEVIVSIGASTYGATRVELSLPKMLSLLKDCGLIDFDLLAVSPGSESDHGVGTMEGLLFDNTRDTVMEIAIQSGAPVIDEPFLAESIKKRMELYGTDVKLFVNVGGAGANIGSSMEYLNVKPGLSMKLDVVPESETRGVLYEFASMGIPVVNLLNIKQIASDEGLAVDSVPLPDVGEGGVYYETAYNKILIIVSLLIIIAYAATGVLFFGRRRTP
ncbi:MAG: poly-gamma-glutamate system protein [Spirochaetales bacterium]|nr:poly-gamma-glutamate system protein [Spirochaetales bacterium]